MFLRTSIMCAVLLSLAWVGWAVAQISDSGHILYDAEVTNAVGWASPDHVSHDAIGAQAPAPSPPTPLSSPVGLDGQDPFSYNMPASGGEFLPYAQGTIPAGIEVLGIVVPEGGLAVAALRMPGQSSLLYVRQGDVVGVHVTSQRAGKPAVTSAGRTRTAAVAAPTASTSQDASDVLYIEIGDITDQQVELYPVTNPENVRILR